MSRIIAAIQWILTLTFITWVNVAGAESVGAAATDPAPAAPPPPPQIAAQAPKQHVVVPGDTLWGIAAKFLQEPWRWPEIWRLNRADIQNPHRIYPGNVVVLENDAQGVPRLRLAQDAPDKTSNGAPAEKRSPQIYSTPNIQAIPSIPHDVIAPFTAEPLVMDGPTQAGSARIVAMQQDRFFLGKDDQAFVAGVAGRTDLLWQVYRPAQPIVDPETRKHLAYEAIYLGTARQRASGDPATFEITAAKQEMTRGDWLIPAVRPPLMNYVPHAPVQPFTGRIAGVYGGLGVGGRYSVVMLNRGVAEGLEPGHVLALFRRRVDSFRDFEAEERKTLVLPPVRYGLVFVFRTFEHLAYALVVEADERVEINDDVRNP